MRQCTQAPPSKHQPRSIANRDFSEPLHTAAALQHGDCVSRLTWNLCINVQFCQRGVPAIRNHPCTFTRHSSFSFTLGVDIYYERPLQLRERLASNSAVLSTDRHLIFSSSIAVPFCHVSLRHRDQPLPRHLVRRIPRQQQLEEARVRGRERIHTRLDAVNVNAVVQARESGGR